MKKLFLTSVFCNVGEKLLELIPRKPENLKVGFIANAADLYVDRWFVDCDRDKLEKLGFTVFDFDLKGKTQEEVKIFLDRIDIIFFSGGTTNYLLKISQKCGLDKMIREYVSNGLLFIGSSAGAIVAGPTTEPYFKEESEDPDIKGDVKPKSFEAFKLVDFIVLPHYNQEFFKKYNDDIIKEYSSKFSVQTLKDNKGLYIEDDVVKKV